ncbi:homeobox protein NANOG isoform X2 [Apodemus sylvaticus]|uniref:homeobox protein NANOG isoform X2 n=1 Tax=Apodemus sylvaticus TaxID=10129 RepID=UPI002243AB1D|nr:homeobox protein NANOG isoform X2 [Apodemus sylvaticus]
MNLGLPGPLILPSSEEASTSGDSSPMPAVLHPKENYSCLQVSATEMLHTETASPCPSSVDLTLHDSPDSSTNPKLKLCSPEADERPEEKEESRAVAKKQKTRTVFSQAQLCALKDRFQRQRYLSLQQMQELSSTLNLSYKQVKTWFQNQRMKCKRWQKNQWLKTSNGLTQGSAYPSVHCSYPQGYLVNASGSLPMWDSQTWTNSTWTNQTWTNPALNNQAWTTQSWCTQAWNSQTWNAAPLHSFGEDSLQPYMQLQQNYSASDLEMNLEATRESQAHFSTPQALELFLNYSLNPPGEL